MAHFDSFLIGSLIARVGGLGIPLTYLTRRARASTTIRDIGHLNTLWSCRRNRVK